MMEGSGRIRIFTSDYWIQIQEAKKHVAPVDPDPDLDPDPQHCFKPVISKRWTDCVTLKLICNGEAIVLLKPFKWSSEAIVSQSNPTYLRSFISLPQLDAA